MPKHGWRRLKENGIFGRKFKTGIRHLEDASDATEGS